MLYAKAGCSNFNPDKRVGQQSVQLRILRRVNQQRMARFDSNTILPRLCSTSLEHIPSFTFQQLTGLPRTASSILATYTA